VIKISSEAQGHLNALWAALGQAHLEEGEYRDLLMRARNLLQSIGAVRGAGAASLFMGDWDHARQCAANTPEDLAYIAMVQKDFRLAAQNFEEADLLAHAAFALFDAGDFPRSRAMWKRVCERAERKANLYVAGLALYNLSRVCSALKDEVAARRYAIQSIHRLERAADAYELSGQRERAFDCFLVVMAIGREGGFENLAEGYLGCIRILAGDQLRHYVVQYYEDFLRLATERGEHHAAGTLYREAADYSRDNGLPYAAYYRGQAGEAYIRAAESLEAAGASAEMVENSLAAAIDCFNALGLWSRIRSVYEILSGLELSEKRRSRYLQLAARVGAIRDVEAKVVGVPDHLRVSVPYPEVWRSDVIEWEQGGDPAATMMQVAVDPKVPSFSRRRAQTCVLFQRAYKEGATLGLPLQMGSELLSRLAELIGNVETWESLAPLEALFEDGDYLVRTSCIDAVGRLYFKRSFQLISRGVEDDNAQVRASSIQAITSLFFPHAYEPLVRIFRSSQDIAVQTAAIRSLGKIRSSEAVDALLEALRESSSSLHEVIVDLLVRSEVRTAPEQIRAELDLSTGLTRSNLEKVLRAR